MRIDRKEGKVSFECPSGPKDCLDLEYYEHGMEISISKLLAHVDNGCAFFIRCKKKGCEGRIHYTEETANMVARSLLADMLNL